jgi:hypothetical protein
MTGNICLGFLNEFFTLGDDSFLVFSRVSSVALQIGFQIRYDDSRVFYPAWIANFDHSIRAPAPGLCIGVDTGDKLFAILGGCERCHHFVRRGVIENCLDVI